MKTMKAAFYATRLTFGTLHFALQTAADLCVEAEVAIVKKTGIPDKDGNMQKIDADQYREYIRKNTIDIQDRSKERFRKMYETIKSKEAKMKVA